MNLELFPQARARAGTCADSRRAELGAYEALMAHGQKLSRIAGALRQHVGLRLADLASVADVSIHAAQTAGIIRAAGLGEVGVRTQGSAEWPARLRDATDIALLYTLGRWDLVSARCVAVVGTRQPSAAALARTAEWVRCLVAEGFAIVSGLARGVDTCALRAALAAGGRTIAVLGTPLSTVYPTENRALQRRIATQQLLVSHVPFIHYANQSLQANREFFLQRNAIITALSEATLIIEAGETSGALVAARHALRQGRRLLIPESALRDETLQWPAKLAAQGGICVKDYAQISAQLAARTM